jgi:hypothetical protein
MLMLRCAQVGSPASSRGFLLNSQQANKDRSEKYCGNQQQPLGCENGLELLQGGFWFLLHGRL